MPQPESAINNSTSVVTKVLHFGIAAGVIAQLIIGDKMQKPRPGRPEDPLFEWHEFIGLATLALLMIYWVWAWRRSGEKAFGAFFPWFSSARLGELWSDTKSHLAAMKRGALPPPEDLPLPSALHGLGIICATLLAASGAIGYFIKPLGFVLEIHAPFVTPMWAYLIGHVVMAMWHELRGDRIIGRMLRVWR